MRVRSNSGRRKKQPELWLLQGPAAYNFLMAQTEHLFENKRETLRNEILHFTLIIELM